MFFLHVPQQVKTRFTSFPLLSRQSPGSRASADFGSLFRVNKNREIIQDIHSSWITSGFFYHSIIFLSLTSTGSYHPSEAAGLTGSQPAPPERFRNRRRSAGQPAVSAQELPCSLPFHIRHRVRLTRSSDFSSHMFLCDQLDSADNDRGEHHDCSAS